MSAEKYMKTQVVVEAMRLTPETAKDIERWCGGKIVEIGKPSDPTDVYLGLRIPTLEGVMQADGGDYVIKGVAGEFYPCKPDIFAKTYESVGHTQSWDYVLARRLGLANGVVQMQADVAEFQKAMGLPVVLKATALPQDRVPLRVQLIEEEFDELKTALAEGDLVETADACVDLLYVVFGLMVETGLDARVLFDEVHRSNMSKFGADGKPIIAGPNDPDGIFEGRVKKGPNYFRPNLAGIIGNGMGNLGE